MKNNPEMTTPTVKFFDEYAEDDFYRDGLLPPRSRPAVPLGPQDLATIIDASVAARPDDEALVGAHARYTYAQLEVAVRAATAALQSLGLRAGDRIAASLPNDPDIVIAFLATQRLNAVWVGINRPSATAEKLHILRDSGASILLATPLITDEISAVMAELPNLRRIVTVDAREVTAEWQQLVAKHVGAPRAAVPIDPSRPATIAYTSGTTGRPKGVVQNQHNLALCIAGRADAGQIYSRNGVATSLTIVNIMITSVLTPLMTGHFVACIERLYLPDIVKWIEAEKLEIVGWVPTLIYDLLENLDQYRSAIGSLKATVVGTTHVPEEARDRIRAQFGNLIFAYGLTEAPCYVAVSRLGRPNPAGASGAIAPHLAVQIRDTDGKVLPAGKVGEIWMGPRESGPWAGAYTPMLGYWHNPTETKLAISGTWVRTGDLGSLDDDENLTIHGRLKEMIIRGGANIYSAEIERVLGEHDGIVECAVIGKPDDRLGETVVAIVQLAPDVPESADLVEQFSEFCRASLAKYKIPDQWIFVKSMPRNEMGKIKRPELRNLL